MNFVNNTVFIATSGGTGSFNVFAAARGYQSPVGRTQDTKSYRYRAQSADLLQWEIGTAVASNGGATFSRTVYASSTGVAVNFTNAPTVMLTVFAEDYPTNATSIPFTPVGNISATDVQSAVAELDAEKAAISSFANTLPFSSSPSDLITTLTAWTPVITFATPGDLAVTYSTQFGRWTKLSSNLVLVQFYIATSALTYTTAVSTLQITGLPFTSANVAGQLVRGALSFFGINKVGYSQIAVGMGVNTNFLVLNASGMGVGSAAVSTTDVPSGSNLNLIGEIVIFI